MHKLTKKSILKKNIPKITLIASIFFLTLLINTYLYNFSPQSDIFNNYNDENYGEYNQNLESSNGQSFLFQGIESPLNINDTANLYELNQEITISNEEELNLSYYLDDVNDWKISKIETDISNLQDTRNWINNSEFQPVQIFRKYQVYESNGGSHPYASNHDAYNDVEHTITESGAYYMRVHFVESTFDYQNDATDSDFMVIYNNSYSEVLSISGSRTDFYSPWGLGDTLMLSYESDNDPTTRDYGYYIDYYEFLNASSNLEVNTENWQGRYVQSGTWGSNTYGFGNITGADAMFVGYHGSYWDDLESFVFYENSFTEFYQNNIVIPRGKVIDAYLSFDYYAQFALDTNNIIMYMSINGEKVYSKRFT